MSDLDVIRAWKDEVYRNSLSADEQALLPANPAGAMELTDDELKGVDGGSTPICESIIVSLVTEMTNIASNWVWENVQTFHVCFWAP